MGEYSISRPLAAGDMTLVLDHESSQNFDAADLWPLLSLLAEGALPRPHATFVGEIVLELLGGARPHAIQSCFQVFLVSTVACMVHLHWWHVFLSSTALIPLPTMQFKWTGMGGQRWGGMQQLACFKVACWS